MANKLDNKTAAAGAGAGAGGGGGGGGSGSGGTAAAGAGSSSGGETPRDGSTSTLRDFELAEQLGKGSFGVVFRVRRKADGGTYVLKQIDTSALNAKEQSDAITEVHVLAALDSPYVVRYYDSFLDSGCLNIVMEYCSGGDLHRKLKFQKNKLLPEDDVWRYFICTALGLHHIHSKKILHRDLKTMNLFLDSMNRIKIGDLGVAKVLGSKNYARTVVGTPYYLSPELCEDKPYNEKSDVWALGCILYELAALRHPFEAQNQGALVLKIIRGRYAPLPAVFSPNLSAVLDLCLAKAPDRRPSVAQLLASPFVSSKAGELKLALPADILELKAAIDTHSSQHKKTRRKPPLNNNANLVVATGSSSGGGGATSGSTDNSPVDTTTSPNDVKQQPPTGAVSKSGRTNAQPAGGGVPIVPRKLTKQPSQSGGLLMPGLVGKRSRTGPLAMPAASAAGTSPVDNSPIETNSGNAAAAATAAKDEQLRRGRRSSQTGAVTTTAGAGSSLAVGPAPISTVSGPLLGRRASQEIDSTAVAAINTSTTADVSSSGTTISAQMRAGRRRSLLVPTNPAAAIVLPPALTPAPPGPPLSTTIGPDATSSPANTFNTRTPQKSHAAHQRTRTPPSRRNNFVDSDNSSQPDSARSPFPLPPQTAPSPSSAQHQAEMRQQRAEAFSIFNSYLIQPKPASEPVASSASAASAAGAPADIDLNSQYAALHDQFNDLMSNKAAAAAASAAPSGGLAPASQRTRRPAERAASQAQVSRHAHTLEVDVNVNEPASGVLSGGISGGVDEEPDPEDGEDGDSPINEPVIPVPRAAPIPIAASKPVRSSRRQQQTNAGGYGSSKETSPNNSPPRAGGAASRLGVPASNPAASRSHVVVVSQRNFQFARSASPMDGITGNIDAADSTLVNPIIAASVVGGSGGSTAGHLLPAFKAKKVLKSTSNPATSSGRNSVLSSRAPPARPNHRHHSHSRSPDRNVAAANAAANAAAAASSVKNLNHVDLSAALRDAVGDAAVDTSAAVVPADGTALPAPSTTVAAAAAAHERAQQNANRARDNHLFHMQKKHRATAATVANGIQRGAGYNVMQKAGLAILATPAPGTTPAVAGAPSPPPQAAAVADTDAAPGEDTIVAAPHTGFIPRYPVARQSSKPDAAVAAFDSAAAERASTRSLIAAEGGSSGEHVSSSKPVDSNGTASAAPPLVPVAVEWKVNDSAAAPAPELQFDPSSGGGASARSDGEPEPVSGERNRAEDDPPAGAVDDDDGGSADLDTCIAATDASTGSAGGDDIAIDDDAAGADADADADAVDADGDASAGASAGASDHDDSAVTSPTAAAAAAAVLPTNSKFPSAVAAAAAVAASATATAAAPAASGAPIADAGRLLREIAALRRTCERALPDRATFDMMYSYMSSHGGGTSPAHGAGANGKTAAVNKLAGAKLTRHAPGTKSSTKIVASTGAGAGGVRHIATGINVPVLMEKHHDTVTKLYQLLYLESQFKKIASPKS